MKRIFSLLFCVSLLLGLWGCQGQTGEQAIISQPYYTGAVGNSCTVFDGGAVYRKNLDNYLHVLDFSTGKADIFCSRPNCLHNDSTCNGYGEDDLSSFFTAGNKLYYLKSLDPELDPEINAYRVKCELMVSDLNRQNEQKIGTLNGLWAAIRVYFWENSAFLFIMDSPISSSNDLKETLYLVEIDLVSNKIKEPIKVSDEFSNIVQNVAGVYEGELYFETCYMVEPISAFSDVSQISHESAYWRYNVKNGKLKQAESALPDHAPPAAETGSVIAFNNGYCIIGDPFNYAPLSVLNLSNWEVTPLCDKGALCFSYGSFLYFVKEEPNGTFTPDRYRFNTSTGEIETVYSSAEKFPVGSIGSGIIGENEEYFYYSSSTAYSGAIDGYEEGSPLICRAKKDEITTPGYHAEITY